MAHASSHLRPLLRPVLPSLATLLLATALLSCLSSSPAAITTPSRRPLQSSSASPLRLNQLQLLATHNSYKLAPSPELRDYLASLLPADVPAALDYAHPDLTDQLENFGVRAFELDVYADPDGGRFGQRAGPKLAGINGTSPDGEMWVPGWKVMHTQDVDFETVALTLKEALGEMRAWSERRGAHVPVIVWVEPKRDQLPEGLVRLGNALLAASEAAGPDTFAEVLDINATLLLDLESEVLNAFTRDQLLLPGDLLTSDNTPLAQAVLPDRWPLLDDVRGKFVFVLDPAVRDIYLNARPALSGAVFFTSARAESGHEGMTDAIFVAAAEGPFKHQVERKEREDVLKNVAAAEISAAVGKGYFVRTQVDNMGVLTIAEARQNDTFRRDAFIAAGAHAIRTDFLRPSDLFPSTYSVPAVACGRSPCCNPVNAGGHEGCQMLE
eukprot:evm.model.scf_1266.4 EVM.evm.TU.scf_1266.4   scf_1266:32107-34021(-)